MIDSFIPLSSVVYYFAPEKSLISGCVKVLSFKKDHNPMKQYLGNKLSELLALNSDSGCITMFTSDNTDLCIFGATKYDFSRLMLDVLW